MRRAYFERAFALQDGGKGNKEARTINAPKYSKDISIQPTPSSPSGFIDEGQIRA